jgi:predicted DNA-binding transcriptional regulator YafY
MKIDRLFAELTYLMNREVVSARKLADRFEVSIRTIQRDMDTLALAGMPVVALRGPKGGYGIMKEYKLDRQLINTSDLFFILTSLESICATLENKKMGQTLEKIKTLVGDYQKNEISAQKEQLQIDFSAFSVGRNRQEVFALLQKSIETCQLIEFGYTDSFHKETQRTVEPMTLTFKWFSWYLYGFCRLRNDYRFFRLSRIRNTRPGRHQFTRRRKSLEQYMEDSHAAMTRNAPEIKLKFHPSMKANVDDYWQESQMEIDAEGYPIITVQIPENDWLYGMILSYGDRVEVLEPAHLRKIIRQKSLAMVKKYQD